MSCKCYFILAIMIVFSSCKKVDLTAYTGIYNGRDCSSGLEADTSGNVQYVTECDPESIEVIINPHRDDKLRILYYGNRDVKVDDGSFDDDEVTGRFWADSLYIAMSTDKFHGRTFRGKKQ